MATTSPLDSFLIYQFLRRLTMPFDQWEAFKQGIIDKDGNIIKPPNERRTIKERDSFKLFDLMVLKLKKLLAKLPAGDTRLATYAAALWLVREQASFKDNIIIENEDIEKYYNSAERFIKNGVL